MLLEREISLSQSSTNGTQHKHRIYEDLHIGLEWDSTHDTSVQKQKAIYALDRMATMLCRILSYTALPILHAQLSHLTFSSFEGLYSTD
jgi:hypothetical protein